MNCIFSVCLITIIPHTTKYQYILVGIYTTVFLMLVVGLVISWHSTLAEATHNLTDNTVCIVSIYWLCVSGVTVTAVHFCCPNITQSYPSISYLLLLPCLLLCAGFSLGIFISLFREVPLQYIFDSISSMIFCTSFLGTFKKCKRMDNTKHIVFVCVCVCIYIYI